MLLLNENIDGIHFKQIQYMKMKFYKLVNWGVFIQYLVTLLVIDKYLPPEWMNLLHVWEPLINLSI